MAAAEKTAVPTAKEPHGAPRGPRLPRPECGRVSPGPGGTSWLPVASAPCLWASDNTFGLQLHFVLIFLTSYFSYFSENLAISAVTKKARQII